MMRDDFIAAALAMKDVPYLHQGRRADLGVDCVGLAVVAASAVGIEIADSKSYARRPTGASLIDGLTKNSKMIFEAPRPGDLLVFVLGKNPQHVAIFLGNGRMVHSHSSAGKVVEHDYEATWQRRHVATFRLPFGDEA